MRVALVLAVILGMGFAGAKIAQSGDIRATTRRIDEQIHRGVDAARALVSSPTSEQLTEPANVDAATESSHPGADVPAGATITVAYVTNTGGVGVALRSACLADARVPGGLAEGARVEVIELGEGNCQGWSLVVTDDAQSWVSDQYLGTGGGRSLASSRADGE